MTTLITIRPAQAYILAMIDRHSKLQSSTKKRYNKAIRGYLDTSNHLSELLSPPPNTI